MFCIKLNVNKEILIVLFALQVCLAQRRITHGKILGEDENKPYMVYFIRAHASAQEYDTWLCGGALVTSRSIITAAACIEDVRFMYAIAGFKKYVPLDKLSHNPCTNEAKKKVVVTCVPKNYDFKYETVEHWSNIDIGIARVESPYDLTKTVPRCSYAPAIVKVNFEEKWQIPGLDAFVLGWGHAKIWRKDGDKTDYNQADLHYATTLIIKKEECKKDYLNTPQLHDIIDRYMICTNGSGNISPQGDVIADPPRINAGCDPSRRYRNPESCEDQHPVQPYEPYPPYGQPPGYGPPQPYYGPPMSYGRQIPGNYMPPNPGAYGQPYPPPYNVPSKSRRAVGNSTKEANADLYSTNETFNQNSTFWGNGNTNQTRRSATRRNGICQNDHGGPLVTWVGAKEYLIGVASVFRIDENNECTGPYLFTSTQCNAAFLDCVLGEDADWPKKKNATKFLRDVTNTTINSENLGYFRGYSRKEFCDLPAVERGFEMVRRQISWVHHPDGPAENELTQHDLENLEMRPQIPIAAFSGR